MAPETNGRSIDLCSLLFFPFHCFPLLVAAPCGIHPFPLLHLRLLLKMEQ